MSSPAPKRRRRVTTETKTAAPARMAKRSISIAGHRTSLSLEDAFWSALKEIAQQRGVSLAGLVREVDAARSGANLSSALRVFVLERFRER
jgi:predicted DNA-binding ribbon-helix-helix protein